jgi:hypothetical protein
MWYRYFRCGIGIFPLRAFSDTTSEIISNRVIKKLKIFQFPFTVLFEIVQGWVKVVFEGLRDLSICVWLRDFQSKYDSKICHKGDQAFGIFWGSKSFLDRAPKKSCDLWVLSDWKDFLCYNTGPGNCNQLYCSIGRILARVFHFTHFTIKI